MRIGIDARLYQQTGVGRYLHNLIEELGFLDKKNEYFVYLKKQEFENFIPVSSNWKKRLADIPWHTFQEQIIMPVIFLRDNLDIVHIPYFNAPIFYPKRYLLTIHDLIVDHFETGRASSLPFLLYQLKRVAYRISLSLGLRRASFITAISQTTKKELVDHYQLSPPKIKVTYNALDNHFLETVKKMQFKNHYKFPYLLYVGNAYPHKNLERMLQALKLIKKEKKIKLVLAGNDHYFYPRLKLYAKQLGLEKEVIFFGNADDEQLINLYHFAECLVFPSLMEGFGLPILEALACGILPVVADIPVFREIWDDQLVFFNPSQPKSIAEKVIQVLGWEKIHCQKVVRKAKEHLNYFNWEKTGRITLEIYEKIKQNDASSSCL